jgi:hypothetical protein
MGPGGLDSRLYWRAPTPLIQGASPESEDPFAWGSIESDEGVVGALRGQADAVGEGEPSVPPGESEASTSGATFPPLEPELQERFRRAWFDGASEAELLKRANDDAAPIQPASSEAATPGAEVAEEATENIEVEGAAPVEVAATETTPQAVTPETYAPDQEGYEGEDQDAALDELVLVPRAALRPQEYLGTDPRFDPFVNDARLIDSRRGGAPTGGATTGGAWTGGATTGGATTGGAWTGGAWTGGATTGGAWTGGAWGSW